jgi:hypothetical protein
VSRAIVVFEQTGEKRQVVRRCKRCQLSYAAFLRSSQGVVSANGIEHIGADYGMTECGIDATGDRWWWPL